MLRPTAIAYGNGHYVMSGGGPMEYSATGLHWTVSPTGNLFGMGVAFGNGTFVAVGGSETILQSDPIVWLQSSEAGTLEISGPIGLEFEVQATDSMNPSSVWTTVMNGTLVNSPQSWTDPEWSDHETRLYRVVYEP
jgi:hypothetical protein